MSRRLQAALAKLLQSEAGQLPASQLTTAQRTALDSFAQRTGAVVHQPSRRGVIYRIAQPAVVDQHWRELTPRDAEAIDPGLPNRAQNIARSRASKSAGHGHEVHYLLLKSATAVSWHTDSGQTLDLLRASRQQGATVLAIGGDSEQSWRSPGELWLVENQALLDRLDWLPDPKAASVAYYGGQLRNSLIDWLAAQPRAAAIRFFPDYDGVGLLNYLRIRQRLGNGVSFWLMPDWEARLRRFGNNALWQDTRREFRAALPVLQPLLADEPELLRLIETMQTLGLALEQEAVWL